MGSPHAVGVAALIVSQYGKADRVRGGLTLAPSRTENILSNTAVEHACPQPWLFRYSARWASSRSTPSEAPHLRPARVAGVGPYLDARPPGVGRQRVGGGPVQRVSPSAFAQSLVQMSTRLSIEVASSPMQNVLYAVRLTIADSARAAW